MKSDEQINKTWKKRNNKIDNAYMKGAILD